ncbi:fas-binding factor 1 homolog isoform X2 [Magallana gigas]|uniref:fas-binding factor 1 homolog isoform X2 n=1 Tax=Magallana gigas TaxID=29159 RepID=UPI003341BD4F
MDNLWTPGAKKQSKVSTEGLDDLLGDLLVDDVPAKKKTPSQPVGGVKPGTKKQGSKDEDFYSNLAATAEDDLSDVSEADVNQMARSLQDLEDMDADLFGGKFKKKGSVKGGSERSSKPNTPRRTGTPRSRSTTPRASSPQTRVTSPTARVTSPVGRVNSPAGRGTGGSPTPDQSLTPRGGSLKKTPAAKSTSFLDQKPGTAPGKMTDIGNASESLKPGAAQPQERPGTVPKAKSRFDYAEMDMDDLLADLTDDEEDSMAAKAKKPAPKQQKEETTVKKQRSAEDITPHKSIENEDSKKRNIFDRPPTRSGGNTETEEPVKPAQTKKKEEPGIFSDDDDFLGGLGIEEKGPSAPKAKLTEEEDDKPARSVMDKLLAKDSAVSKHLETKKERREFVLDKKYTQPNNEEEDEDFQFGGYQPSVVSTSSRPTSRRSVRFQDEDDIFGFDRPPSRGRSPASSLTKKPDDMDWLNDITTAVKSAPSISSTPPKQENKPTPQTDPKPTSVKTDNMPQTETKTPEPKPLKPQDKETEPKTTSSSAAKPKGSASDWLGLNDADDEDDEPASWMRAKSQQKTTPPSSAGEKRKDWLSSHKLEDSKPSQKSVPKSEPKGSPADWLGLTSSKEEEDEYLKMENDLDPNSLLKSRLESPAFGGKSVRSDDTDLFKTPTRNTGASSMPYQSSGRKLQTMDTIEKTPTPQRAPDIGGVDELMGLPLTGGQTERFYPQREDRKPAPAADLFNLSNTDQDMITSQAEILKQQQQQQENLLAQQAKIDEMMRKQYEQAAKFQVPPPPVFTPEARTSVMTNPPRSLIEAQTRLYKMEIERDYAYSVLEMNKRRFDEEKQTIENSYKSRLELIEDTHKNKETRLREENELLMNQYLSKVRQLENDKSDQSSQYQRRLEEFQRDKDQDIDRLKSIHRRAIEDMKREYEEDLERLKKAKDQQIEAAMTSNDTTKSLVQAVSMIQSNARDLGELQKKVDSWHNMGLDEREIAIRSKDEQLKILQERLNRQQEENDLERKRLEDLISRLETQLREQTRMLDEERWKVKQEQTRLQSLQSSLEEERRLWTEQQARERSNIEKTRETLLEEQKSVLSQLHKERQSVAEERTKLNVSLTVQREESEDAAVKLAQAKAEFEALMKAISEEKSKQNIIRQELQREEDRLDSERRKLEMQQAKMAEKEKDFLQAAQTLKERSEEMDQLFIESQSKAEEGNTALMEAMKIEREESERAANLQHQIQVLRLKEREIADDRLRLSKEKKEVENLKSAMLCPNCRTPAGAKPQGGEQVIAGQYNNASTYQVYSSPAVQQSNPAMQHNNPAMQQSLNSVGSITETIKADRSIRMWKMEALKDQKYLEEQSMFLYTLKHMPYSGSNSKS